MRIEDLQLFIAIADAGSMTQAADRLGLTKSVVSRRLADLEADVGTQLFFRSTRQMTLTPEGELFYERVVPVVGELDAAREDLFGARRALAGVIRVAAPVSFGHAQLAGALFDFAAAHPAVQLRVELSDRTVDLLEEGFDVAVRIGRLPDSELVARTLAVSHRAVVCSPSFAATHGAPKTLEDLERLPCVAYANRSVGGEWLFETTAGRRSVHPAPRFSADTGELALRAAAAGLGVTVTPTFLASPLVLRGELVPITIPGAQLVSDDICAVRPAQRQPSRRVRALIDHLLAAIPTPPPWDAAFGSVAG